MKALSKNMLWTDSRRFLSVTKIFKFYYSTLITFTTLFMLLFDYPWSSDTSHICGNELGYCCDCVEKQSEALEERKSFQPNNAFQNINVACYV